MVPDARDVELGHEEHLEEFFDVLQEEVADRSGPQSPKGIRTRNHSFNSFSRNTSCSSFQDALSEWELEVPAIAPPRRSSLKSSWPPSHLRRPLELLGISLCCASTAFALRAPYEATEALPLLLMLFAFAAIAASLLGPRMRSWSSVLAGTYLYAQRWRGRTPNSVLEWLAAGVAVSRPCGGSEGFPLGLALSSALWGMQLSEQRSWPTLVLGFLFLNIAQLLLHLAGDNTRAKVDHRLEWCAAISRVSQEPWVFSAAVITGTLGFGGRYLGLQGLDLSVGRPPQKARPLLLLLAMLPMLMGWAARSSVGGESRILKWTLVSLSLGFSLLPNQEPDPCWAHEDGSLSAMAVGRALLLHLELATVPLLVAALCSCAPMTPVATLRRPLGTSSAPISAAQAAAVVATVFLADRAAERLLVKRWWVATLGNLLAALLCLNFPEARRPRLSEWAGNYANLRAASSSAAMAAGRRPSSFVPSTLASSRVASAADLVGGLRRLSARLLKPPLQEQEEAHDPSFWNCLLAELWPSLRGMIEEDILKGEVQSVLQESVTAALKFDTAFLGTEPPKVLSLRMLSTHRPERSILFVMDTEFVSKEVDLTLKLTLGSFMGLSLGVSKLTLRGKLFLGFRHLTPHLPLTQGLTVGFADPPAIDLEVTTPSALGVPFVPERARAALISVISSTLAHQMVLPNRIPLPFGTLWPLDRLQHARPEGVLACRVLGACGVTSTNRPLSCVLQLGAASYRSAKSESEDGDFLWDEEPFLVVDHFEQSLLLALHERHTFNDRAIAHQAISIKELIDRSRWQHMPSWSLQAMGSETTTPQLLFSSSFHELSRKRASFAGLGSLLLLTVDCARHVPPELDGALLMLRCFVVPPGGVPPPNLVRGDAQSVPMRCSRITPVQAGQAIVERLLMCNFDQTAQAVQIAGDSSEEEVDVKQAWEAYVESEEDRWRERLTELWQLRGAAAPRRHAGVQELKEWLNSDREGCIRRMALILELPVWCEVRLGKLLDELATQKGTPAHKASTSSNATQGPCVECHWRQQLRLVAKSPRDQELYLEICQAHRRADPEVVGIWRKPLRDLLDVAHMTDRMAPRMLLSPKASATSGVPPSTDEAAKFAVHLKLELLHLRPEKTQADWVVKRQYVASVERSWYQEPSELGGCVRLASRQFLPIAEHGHATACAAAVSAAAPASATGDRNASLCRTAASTSSRSRQPPLSAAAPWTWRGGLSLCPEPESENPIEKAEKAEDEAATAVEEAVKSEVSKMGKQKEKVMENDPDNTRIAHDTADAVSIYMQKKIMPTFSGHTSKEIRDLIDDSRQLLQKVHRKLRALKEPPADTGAAAAAEGNAAKQAQKGKTSALLLWATPPIRGSDFLPAVK
ncbi:unnamed protein product [Durusdinium trenchii]|uniref:SMP-LTD domain-containing protein n=1 Tax=Durusdinium trenchii TaxID=1381693 RepID=A0ABP0JX15_9DINO